MKIPENIFGQNKLRDAAIIKLYQEGFTPEEIVTIRNLNINARRVQDILYKNRALIKIDKHWERIKQINRIKRRIIKAKETKKDVHDWEELLNKLIEEDAGVKIEEHTHYSVINYGTKSQEPIDNTSPGIRAVQS